MKRIVFMLAALLTISLCACSQNKKQGIKQACEDLKAAYPDITWKEGKLLNRTSKKDLETWIKGL